MMRGTRIMIFALIGLLLAIELTLTPADSIQNLSTKLRVGTKRGISDLYEESPRPGGSLNRNPIIFSRHMIIKQGTEAPIDKPQSIEVNQEPEKSNS